MSRPAARGDADRELRAEVHINATPEQVWEALTDLDRMPERSPELVRMVPLKRGGLRPGQWYLGINRRKAVVWPTRNIVKIVEPGARLTWHTATSGATWIHELEPVDGGTRLVQRRPVPRLTFLSRITAGSVLGGGAQHADELEDGMATTLTRLKAEIEG